MRHLHKALQAQPWVQKHLDLTWQSGRALGGSPWEARLGTWAGVPWAWGRTCCGSCQHPSRISLRAVGWERLKAAVITPKHSFLGTQCHRTDVVILSHQPLQAQELGWSLCSQCLLYFMVEIHTAGVLRSLVCNHSLVSFPMHFNALERH